MSYLHSLLEGAAFGGGWTVVQSLLERLIKLAERKAAEEEP